MEDHFMSSFYSRKELEAINFKQVGNNVLLSRNASIYGSENMILGDNVRIDDFCILSGKITLGNYIHISAYTALYGGNEGIYIEDFVGISSRTCVYSTSDDYSGEAMTNPMVPDKYRKVESKPIHIGRHVIIGSTSVVFPGVNIAEGSSFGAFTLINKDSEPWSINVGIPFKKIKERKKDLLKLEKEFYRLDKR